MVLGNEGLCLSMSAVILEWLSFQKLKNVPALLSVAMKKRQLFFITHTQQTVGLWYSLVWNMEAYFGFCSLQHPFPIRFLRNYESSFIVAGVQSWASFEWPLCKAGMVLCFIALAIFALAMEWKWIFLWCIVKKFLACSEELKCFEALHNVFPRFLH